MKNLQQIYQLTKRYWVLVENFKESVALIDYLVVILNYSKIFKVL